jgi:alpha-beta hydrolase superfamily lysophospholipase
VADAVVDFGITRDGLVQLRRHWPATNSRAVLLLIHGIAEHSGRYHHVGRLLSEAGIDVVAIDQRGFGESGGSPAYVHAFGEYLDDIEDQCVELQALGLPLVLLGHSMGGLAALSYVLERRRPAPRLVVLSAPALDADVPAPLRFLMPLFARLAPRLVVPSPVRGDMLATDPAVGAAYAADPLVVRGVSSGLGHALFTQMRWTSGHLGTLAVPTLVLHGGDDPLVPAHVSAPLGSLPGAERRELPGLRHEVFNEPSHAETLRAVVSWIDAHLC